MSGRTFPVMVRLLGPGTVLGDAGGWRFSALERQAEDERFLGIAGHLPEARKRRLGQVALMRHLGVRNWADAAEAVDRVQYGRNDSEGFAAWSRTRGLFRRYVPVRWRDAGPGAIRLSVEAAREAAERKATEARMEEAELRPLRPREHPAPKDLPNGSTGLKSDWSDGDPCAPHNGGNGLPRVPRAPIGRWRPF